MQAWSEQPCVLPDRSGLWRLTGSTAVLGRLGARRAPATVGRLRDGMADASAGPQQADTPTDAELMARIAAGDREAFAAIYDRHAQALYGTVMRFLRDPGAAEDVVQETYLAMWTRSESYSPEAGSLIGWLLTIARHRAIDRLRAASRQPVVVGFAPAMSDGTENDLERLLALGRPVGFGDAADAPADVAERRWVRAVVRTALDEMPDAERQALELAYDDELTQAEIAQRLGWPIGTVKTRTRRALQRLRAILESVPDIGPSPGLPPFQENWQGGKEVRHGPR